LSGGPSHKKKVEKAKETGVLVFPGHFNMLPLAGVTSRSYLLARLSPFFFLFSVF